MIDYFHERDLWLERQHEDVPEDVIGPTAETGTVVAHLVILIVGGGA